MRDFNTSISDTFFKYNTKTLKHKSNNIDVRTQKSTEIDEGPSSYELRQLNNKNYDHYFRNNNRFYNYQRTRQISENSDFEEHFQINNELYSQIPNEYEKETNQKTRGSNICSGPRNNNSSSNGYQCCHHKYNKSDTCSIRTKNTTNHCCKVDKSKVNKERTRDHKGSHPAKLVDKLASCEPEKKNRTIFEFEDDDLKPEPIQPVYIQTNYQLMHPDWRWIPHVPLYGWTPHHEQNIRRLNDEMAEGRITTMYFRDVRDYEESARLYKALKKSNHFLKKPTVSTLEEVFSLIKKTIQHDNRFIRPRHTTSTNNTFRAEDNGYEADVEETII